MSAPRHPALQRYLDSLQDQPEKPKLVKPPVDLRILGWLPEEGLRDHQRRIQRWLANGRPADPSEIQL